MRKNILPHKLIKVTFSIDSLQTIPGKGQASVLMTFHPPPAAEVKQANECVSYALAFISLDSQVNFSQQYL